MQVFTDAYLPALSPRETRVSDNLATRFMKAIRTSHRRGVSVRELKSMDDHALRDIGLDPSQIRSVVDDMLIRPMTH